MKETILWFKDIRKDDVALVGGKGANLGEMTSAGFPVPPGFVVTAASYKAFLMANQLEPKIRDILTGLDVNDPLKLDDAAKQVQKLIKKSSIPDEIALEIAKSYLVLQKSLKKKSLPVAVRSSATSEDSKEASFAGQNATFLNIAGEANLVAAVRDCWASLFEGRSIFYRVQNHFDHFTSYIAVVVQAMIESEVSGILFSIDPVTNNRHRVVVEAIWGLGEYIVQGKITPDHYEVDKSDLTIVEKKVTAQTIMLTRSEATVPKSKRDRQKIVDHQIVELARLAIQLEKHYYFPQDSEFAIASDKIYLVQTRPITTINETASQNTEAFATAVEKALEVILSGAPASPGIKSGAVRVLKSAKEINKIEAGEVLVATQTNPDYVPAMKKAAAIVTDKGGRTSHAAIVSRELGIPCIVGTERATQNLRTGMVVTVDGSAGKIYKGTLPVSQIKALSIAPKTAKSEAIPLRTATKVYVNLAEPEEAKQIAARDCDGVGLLRAEFMLAGIGVHPKKVIKDHQEKDFVQTLANQLTMFAQAFYPRPVVYRATDFKTNEYRTLKGGDAYEPEEANPMLGFRGAYRYIVQPEVFKLELDALKQVRQQTGLKNLHLMIPFCRTVAELVKVKELLAKNGLERSASFQLWLMCEIPSNVIMLDHFLKVGIDGISIGSNDLTMLTLGVDRDNENVASEYSELDPAVMFSFYKVIKTCQKYHVTCSMCGQAPSDFPQLTEKLVQWGITSVSVNPDAISRTRQIVYEAEKRIHANSTKSYAY